MVSWFGQKHLPKCINCEINWLKIASFYIELHGGHSDVTDAGIIMQFWCVIPHLHARHSSVRNVFDQSSPTVSGHVGFPHTSSIKYPFTITVVIGVIEFKRFNKDDARRLSRQPNPLTFLRLFTSEVHWDELCGCYGYRWPSFYTVLVYKMRLWKLIFVSQPI